jgi:DNA-binding beta-propeller fold protein YncE
MAVPPAALAMTLAATACSTGSAPREPTIDATVTVSPDASTTGPPPGPTVAGAVAQEIAVGDGPGDFPTVAFGSLWVPNIADGTISRIDLQTGQVVSTIRIGRSDEPPDRSNVSPFSVAAGGGSVWATRDLNDRYAVVRVDPGTNRVVESFRVDPAPYALAWGAGAV